MDQSQMMLEFLKSKGAAPTPQNMQLAQQFFASNPDQLERRAMGMRGSNGNEDNTDVLSMQLDKLMQQSGAAPAPAALQSDAVAQAGPPQAAPQMRSTPAPTLLPTQGLQYNPNQNLGPLPPKSGPAGIPNALTSGNAAMEGAEAGLVPPDSNNWLLPMLTALLGASSASGRADMSGRGVVADPSRDIATQSPRDAVASGGGATDAGPSNAVGKPRLRRLTDDRQPPIVPIPEVEDGTGKARLTDQSNNVGKRLAPSQRDAMTGVPTTVDTTAGHNSPNGGLIGERPAMNSGNQKALPPYDAKARVQNEYDSGNAELDKVESDMKSERAKQLAKEKLGKAARNVKR